MFVVDTLIVVGVATVSLGTIQESDGVREHRFVLRNDGQEAVVLTQGYTSCGCTTIHFDKARHLMPGDTASVTLRFNPRGKGGDFYESGTLIYVPTNSASTSPRRRIQLALQGSCVSSDETLRRQFPITLADGIRLSTNRFDLGYMSRGEHRERNVVVLHTEEENRQELIPVRFVADENTDRGLQHIAVRCTTQHKGQPLSFDVTFDVVIR